MRGVSGPDVFLARGSGVVLIRGYTAARAGPLLAAAPQGKRSKSRAAAQKARSEPARADRGEDQAGDDGEGGGKGEGVHDSFLLTR